MIEDLLGITGGAAADVHIRAGRFNVFFVSCFLSFSLFLFLPFPPICCSYQPLVPLGIELC